MKDKTNELDELKDLFSRKPTYSIQIEKWTKLHSEIESKIDESIDDPSFIIPLDILNEWLYQIQDFFIEGDVLIRAYDGTNEDIVLLGTDVLKTEIRNLKTVFRDLKKIITNIKHNTIESIPDYGNKSPYPFNDFRSKELFEELLTTVKEHKELAYISYYYQKMKRDGLIVCGNSDFTKCIDRVYGIKLDRIIKPSFDSDKDFHYHHLKSMIKPNTIT